MLLSPKHSLSIHIISQFVKCFFKKLSYNCIDFLRAPKTDGNLIGKTHDFCAVVAETPVHAVVIGAGGIGNGDGALVNGHDVMATVSGRDGEFLVDAQVYSTKKSAVAEDLGVGGRVSGQQKKDAQTDAQDQQNADQQEPFFCCHQDHPFCRKYPRQYSKISEKTQEKVVNSP